ncbi:MAG: ABC transporter permease subunit, partial [Armatimonadetes bacterium]|nr:ABC transporter permease subunit [Armatimonadota bacterium]
MLTGIARWAAGAHWAVVIDNPRLWAVGLLPLEFLPRAWWAAGLVLAAAVLTGIGVRRRVAGRVLGALWAATGAAIVILFWAVRLDQIGGLYLTLLLAAVAITGSFPVGVLVGIGRVSRLPVIRLFCTAYIEIIRGVPLITVLLWFSIFFTLVSGDALTKVQRAII